LWCLGIVDGAECLPPWSQSLGTRGNGSIYILIAGGAVQDEDALSDGKAGKTQWQRPYEGWLKVNTDVAFDSSSCTGRAGVVIRDHLGLVQAATARWLDDVSDALTAEAMAAKEDLELAVENGYDRAILEIDCRGLQTLLEDSSCVRSESI
jgi:hypothetical protein